MWPTLTCLLCITPVALHFSWRRRFAHVQQETANEIAVLRRTQEQAAARKHARRKAIFNSMIERLLLLDNGGRSQLANRRAISLKVSSPKPKEPCCAGNSNTPTATR